MTSEPSEIETSIVGPDRSSCSVLSSVGVIGAILKREMTQPKQSVFRFPFFGVGKFGISMLPSQHMVRYSQELQMDSPIAVLPIRLHYWVCILLSRRDCGCSCKPRRGWWVYLHI